MRLRWPEAMHGLQSDKSFYASPRSPLPLLLPLFFGGGCAALIYEIVWFQTLQLVIGSTAVSLGVLLGTYMGGMCLGSLLLPRIVSARRHPLRVYALLELGIGVIGIIIWFGLPRVSWIYAAHTGGGLPGVLLRGLFAAVCLLPPTILMGATLPAISRWVEATPRGISWLGFFYGGNIAGGVFGCLFAGFYLLRVHDSATTTFVAAGINAAVALAALALAGFTGREAQVEVELPSEKISPTEAAPAKPARLIYLAIALSGLTALGAEVVWTRLLSLMMGGTVYTFSIILAVFLFGLGIGSTVGAALARKAARASVALGWCQFLLTGAIAWTAYMIAQSLPFWPINPALSPSPWFNFQLDLARCLWTLLPATLLWGASFPLALAAARGRDTARLVGGIYAANTVGGILGGVGFSLIFIPLYGTQQCERLLIALSALSALLLAAPQLLAWWKNISFATTLRTAGVFTALVLIPLSLACGVANVPGELIAYGRVMVSWLGGTEVLYTGEGMNSSVAVTRTLSNSSINFHVSGKIEASNEPQDMRLQRMLGHLPALVHPHPQSVLVVGCGAGVTAGTFTVYPSVTNITICEMEPLVPQISARYFATENENVVNDPRTHITFDDARHYILTSHDKFDIITSDPIHPWVKGSATLYTKEYFELVKRCLNPGGIVTQWVPLYESDAAVVKSEIATFFEAFPNGTIWSNDEEGKGYDLVLLGQAGETKINIDEMLLRLARPEFANAVKSMNFVGLADAFALLATYAGRADDLAPWLKDAQINRDQNLRLQYLAGLGLNLYISGRIYDDMLVYRKFPETLFAGSSSKNVAVMKAALASAPGHDSKTATNK
jgi:spermidine synthase